MLGTLRTPFGFVTCSVVTVLASVRNALVVMGIPVRAAVDTDVDVHRLIPESVAFASIAHLKGNCGAAIVRAGPDGTSVSLESFRNHAWGFYESGAPIQGHLSVLDAILARKTEVVKVCPQAVMQALVMRIDALLVNVYIGSTDGRGDHFASLREAATRQAELDLLRQWLASIVGIREHEISELNLDWPIVWGEKRCKRYYDILWDDVRGSKDAWAAMERPGDITDEQYHAALDSVASVLDAFGVEWWPCRGTLIAFLRHGRRSGRLSRGLVDVVERDIDLMLGVPSASEWYRTAKNIERKLILNGWDKCWTKESVDSDSPLFPIVRRDLLYCVRTSPAFMLVDVTSYVFGEPGPDVFVHRICSTGDGALVDGGNAAGGATPMICEVPQDVGPLRHGGGRLRKDAIYPLARCRAADIEVPCPSQPLETIRAMVHTGLDASCIALPSTHGRDLEDPLNQRLRTTGLCADDVRILRERSARLDAMGYLSMLPYFDNCTKLEAVLSRI